MKKLSTSFALLCAASTLLACDAPATATPTPTTPTTAVAMAAGPSFYELPGTFEDHTGRKVALDVSRGHPTLIAMFYAACPMACPMLIGEVNSVLDKLGPEARKKVRVVLVSLDPQNDTVAVLQDVITSRKLDPATFTLLRADESTTRALATVMKVRYAAMDDGEIDHSSRIILLDGAGQAIAEQDGLQRPLDGLIAAVERSAR